MNSVDRLTQTLERLAKFLEARDVEDRARRRGAATRRGVRPDDDDDDDDAEEDFRRRRRHRRGPVPPPPPMEQQERPANRYASQGGAQGAESFFGAAGDLGSPFFGKIAQSMKLIRTLTEMYEYVNGLGKGRQADGGGAPHDYPRPPTDSLGRIPRPPEQLPPVPVPEKTPYGLAPETPPTPQDGGQPVPLAPPRDPHKRPYRLADEEQAGPPRPPLPRTTWHNPLGGQPKTELYVPPPPPPPPNDGPDLVGPPAPRPGKTELHGPPAPKEDDVDDWYGAGQRHRDEEVGPPRPPRSQQSPLDADSLGGGTTPTGEGGVVVEKLDEMIDLLGDLKKSSEEAAQAAKNPNKARSKDPAPDPLSQATHHVIPQTFKPKTANDNADVLAAVAKIV